MRGHIYQMLYKSILREKVRPGRLNRGVFHATNDRLFFAPGLEGGCGKILAQGVAKSYSFISLIPLLLSHVNRPTPCRSRKIGEDDSDPPEKRGVMRPRVGVQCGTPSRVSQGGRYRRYLSLREGSETGQIGASLTLMRVSPFPSLSPLRLIPGEEDQTS